MNHVKNKKTITTTSSSNTTNYNTIEKCIFICIVIPIYIGIRFSMINKLPLMDCDEVYNYWEPLHYMLYNTGLQTWEYSYEYALRTYTYLVPLYLLAQYCYIPLISNTNTTIRHYLYLLSQSILSVDNYPASNDKVLLFYLLRCTISVSTAICELIWLYTLLLYYQKEQPKMKKQQVQQNNKERGTNSMLLTNNYCTNTSTVWYTCITLLCSAGMNHSSGAFLPSTTWISIWCLCCTCYLCSYDYLFAFIAILATLSIGWPFGCVCILPMSIHILYRQYYSSSSTNTSASTTTNKTSLQQKQGSNILNFVYYIIYIIVVSCIVQYYIVMKIDEYYYGTKNIIPTLNIIKYNAGSNSDTLYGVEPISYYIKNLLLNFNILFLFSIITIPLYLIFSYIDYTTVKNAASSPSSTTSTETKSTTAATTTTTTTTTTILIFNLEQFIILLSLPIWFLITFPRPHKEERFLYPIYPILVYGGVQSIQLIVQYYMIQQQKEHEQAIATIATARATNTSTATDTTTATKKKRTKSCSLIRFVYRNIKYVLLLHEQIIPILLIVFCCIISILRTAALSKYYMGPLHVYNRLAFQPVPDIQAIIDKTFYGYPSVPESFKPELVQDNVCVCGEWYRYPSSFFLPNNTQLGFLPSSFTGQLPQPYTKYGSKKESLQYLQPFNDRNEHEELRYVNLNNFRNDCKWFVVLHSESEATLCGWPHLYGKARVGAIDYIDPVKTTSTLHRTLYIPFNNYHKQAVWDDEFIYDTYIIYAEFDNSPIPRLKKYNWITNVTEREQLQKEYARKHPDHDEF